MQTFRLHLNKVISKRFQSHFSDYALTILKYFGGFLPTFVHLHGQQFNGALEKFSFTTSFLG